MFDILLSILILKFYTLGNDSCRCIMKNDFIAILYYNILHKIMHRFYYFNILHKIYYFSFFHYFPQNILFYFYFSNILIYKINLNINRRYICEPNNLKYFIIPFIGSKIFYFITPVNIYRRKKNDFYTHTLIACFVQTN